MAGPSSHQSSSSNWDQIVTSLYPDALTRTYCVPPVHFNRVPYQRVTVPGTSQTALVLHPPSAGRPVHTPAPGTVPPPAGAPVPSRVSAAPSPAGRVWAPETNPELDPDTHQDSDLRDDSAQSHVLYNLQELGNRRGEVMFIVSNLNFGDFLNEPAYAAAAAQLPRPQSMPRQDREGDFDFLIITRHYGVLVGELKAVGSNWSALSLTPAQQDADVAKRVEKAAKQLAKSLRVVRHLVSDVAGGLTVRATLFLPYVSSQQLRRVLGNNSALEQAVCQSLGAADAAQAVQLCCCSDQLSDPARHWDVTPAVMSQLESWWRHRVACTPDPLLTDPLYLQLLARFVGPATTVTVPSYNKVRVAVRTTGQAVAELGWRQALPVLTQTQLDLLSRNPQRVYITGPPGTGKTAMLNLQGMRLLLQGHYVHVVSLRSDSLAVSTLLSQHLRMSTRRAFPAAPGTVHLMSYDFKNNARDVSRAVSDLLARVNNGCLHVLIDEAVFDPRVEWGPRTTLLVDQLTQHVPHLCLWMAGLQHSHTPPSLQQGVLTQPLRSAPAVLREVEPEGTTYSDIHNYGDRGVPFSGDGPRVIRLHHHGNGHTSRWPVDCRQCGQDIAARLSCAGVGNTTANPQDPLSYGDVFVLTRSHTLQDDVMDNTGRVTSAASGVVRGLRDAGVPVCVLGYQDWEHNRARWEQVTEDVSLAATNQATVAYYDHVIGLERRVVVVLSDRNQEDEDEGRTVQQTDGQDRLLGASRCSALLITVSVPPQPN